MLGTQTNLFPALFEGLSSEATDAILQKLKQRTFTTGQYVFHAGQPATCLYLIQQGLVRVVHNTLDGERQILDIVEAGDLVGALFMGEQRHRIGQAQAMCQCTTYTITEAQFADLTATYPIIAMNFIKYLIDSQRELFSRMQTIQRYDAKLRLLGVLLHLSRTMCCTTGQMFQLNPAISQQDLADLTGLNRSTVSSLINRLRNEGLLGGSGRTLLIDYAAVEAVLMENGFELLR